MTDDDKIDLQMRGLYPMDEDSTEFFKESDCEPIQYKTNSGNAITWTLPYNVEYKRYITLDSANRLLRERGTVVRGGKYYSGSEWILNFFSNDGKATHRALLINIEPIEKDSAEQILKEFTPLFDQMFQDGYDKSANMFVFLERAKKLLEKK